MRPKQSTGRPGTPVVPPRWSEAPRVVMAGTRTAMVEIRHPGGTQGPFDPDTGTYPTVPHPAHHAGSARIQALDAQEQEQLVADQQVTTTGYRVSVDLDCDEAAVGDVVKVTALDATIGDPFTVGHELTIRSFAHGSTSWQRHLICTDNLG